MNNTIKITEKQLKMLVEQSQEQRNEEDDLSSLDRSISKYMKDNSNSFFKNEKELLSSSFDRLSNALMLKDWNLVNEVTSDIKKYMDLSYQSKEDVSLENPTAEDENYSMNESIKKLKSTFKRIV